MSEEDKNFVDLPIKVIDCIVKYLTHPDKLNLRRVSKFFYKVTTNKIHIENEYFNFCKDDTSDECKSENIAKILANSQRDFVCFSFRLIKFSDDIIKIFKKFSNITSLELIECENFEVFLMNVLLHCQFLSNLKFALCHQSILDPNYLVFNSKLLNLKSLTFHGCLFLTDVILEKHIQIAPNLETLNLMSLPINFHNANENLVNLSISEITFPYIYDLIQKNASKFKNLTFSHFNFMNGESLRQLCTIKNLELESLSLSGWNRKEDSFNFNLGDWQKNLVKLDLKSCSFVNNEFLLNIGLNLPNLKYLDVSYCKRIDRSGLKHLKNLRKLKHLNISGWRIEYDLSSMVLDLNSLDLHDLRCQYLKVNEQDSDLEFPFFKNLNYLDLSCVALNDKILANILRNCKKLESLILDDCDRLTDDLFLNEIFELKSLRYISLDVCNISDKTLANSFNFPDLRHCSLNYTKVSTAGIISLITKCPRIEVLNLAGCDIDNYCIENLSTLKRLRFLYLVHCEKIDDKGIDFLRSMNIKFRKI